MPELPEVEAVCRQLETVLIGKNLISVSVNLPRIVRHGSLDEFVGRQFTAVKRFGKFIRIDFDFEKALFVHLRMTGQLLWELDSPRIDKFVRCNFITDHGTLYYRDVRTLGGFWVRHPENPPWKNLGPDPMTNDFTVDYLQNQLLSRKLPIKVFLLDQSIIAGIGNIYASEILFESRIHPATPSNKISSLETKSLYSAIVSVLLRAIDAQGTTFRDFRLSDGKEGGFHKFLKVYGHQETPCQTCSTNIERIAQAGRSTYFCPKCQPND